MENAMTAPPWLAVVMVLGVISYNFYVFEFIFLPAWFKIVKLFKSSLKSINLVSCLSFSCVFVPSFFRS